MSKILGIDPGLRITGFGIIEQIDNKLNYVASGTIKTKHLAIGDLPSRIKTIANGITELQQRYQADQAAIEIIFVNVNPQASLMLGQARGAALASLVCQDLEVGEYTALQVKKAITGNGRATKTQIQTMVMHLLNLSSMPGADAADALAIAITHAHVSKMQKQLSKHNQLQRTSSAIYKKGRHY